MEEQTKVLKDYIDAFRRRRNSIFFVAGVIFFVSIIAAVFWPPTYRSTATILIEEQEVPQDLIRSTVTSYATERIQTITQTVMTRANLMQIIQKYDLYHDKRKSETTEEILDRMRKDVKLDMINADVIDPRSGQPRPAAIAFTLSFDGSHPAVAQKVDSELTNLYLSENLKTRTEKSEETYDFLSDEANKLKGHISDLETKLAAFKEKNAGRLPELVSVNMQMQERTENDLRDAENQLHALDDRKFYLEGQLAQVDPYNAVIDENGDRVPDPATRLKMLRSEYISDTAKYAPDYPDIVRLRREIAGLEKETGDVDSRTEQAKQLEVLRSELAAARQKYSPDYPDVISLTKAVAAQEAALKQKPTSNPESDASKPKPDNPAYLTMQADLESINSQIQVYTAQSAQLKEKLNEYERNLQQTPSVERDYDVLTMDYQNSIKRYQDIKEKQGEAQAGQELEKERKGERFSLIDPPDLPEEPITPNRPAILILGFLLAMGGGFGYAAGLESIDSSVHGANGVRAVLQQLPLSIIPYMPNDDDIVRAKKKKRITIAVITSGLVLFVLYIHFFLIPLDVLWFKELRKANTTIGG
ncbi:MAG: GumC family protein [Sulfuricaulis sp.]